MNIPWRYPLRIENIVKHERSKFGPALKIDLHSDNNKIYSFEECISELKCKSGIYSIVFSNGISARSGEGEDLYNRILDHAGTAGKKIGIKEIYTFICPPSKRFTLEDDWHNYIKQFQIPGESGSTHYIQSISLFESFCENKIREVLIQENKRQPKKYKNYPVLDCEMCKHGKVHYFRGYRIYKGSKTEEIILPNGKKIEQLVEYKKYACEDCKKNIQGLFRNRDKDLIAKIEKNERILISEKFKKEHFEYSYEHLYPNPLNKFIV